VLDTFEEMEQVVAHGFVGAHGEGEFALGTGEAAGTLDNAVAQGVEGLECPGRGALGGCRLAAGHGEHLHFTGEVVGYHSAQGIHLVSVEVAGGDDFEGGVLLGVAENRLLGAAPVVKFDDRTGAVALVGHDDLVVVLEIARLEQVELQRALARARHPAAHKHESV
jgi:hypothetical protein